VKFPSLEFDAAVAALCEGTADETAMDALGRLLREDAAARDAYLFAVELHARLASDNGLFRPAEAPGAPEEKVVEFPPAPAGSSAGKAARWLAAAAALIGTAILAFVFLSGAVRDREPFARLVKSAGAESAQPAPLAEGAAVRGEAFVLLKGSVEFATARGAKVVLEAPAEFRFETAQRLRLTRGKAAAEVPPAAKGFTIITPTGQAIDLGTKFGVDVPTTGAAEIHVFQGEVIAQSSGGKRQSLRGGEAFALQTGAGQSRDLRSSAFIRPDEVASLHAALAAGQQTRSDAALADLRRDPALIALLDFESSELFAGSYRVVQGRWPGSRAPEFVNLGDHMKLDAGGDREWPQLTLAAWVRLDRLDDPYQSLVHTDGWDKNNPGQVHWMVTGVATMRLALFGNTLAAGSEERSGFPDGRMSVLPEQGRWAHLAAVYDSSARTVRFYLNGQFDKETRQEIAHPAKLGPAQIGNWNRKDRKLSGRIDELLLLGRAMSDAEVRALFEAGNPYR